MAGGASSTRRSRDVLLSARRDRGPGPARLAVPPGRDRGRTIDSELATHVIATVHPAAILRATRREARQAERERFPG